MFMTSSAMNALQTDIDSLYLEHQQTLVHILRRMVGCHQTAEDLAQEAYLKVSGASKKKTIDYPQPFLYQTAKNLALDYLRKQKVRNTKLVEKMDDISYEQISDNVPTPDIAIQASQELNQLLNLLEKQPKRRREMLILNRVHGWKHSEIADHFGVSKSAVEKNIRIALAHCLVLKSPHQ
jgi:RNA polymerase sigma-70 factor (ECF subfamily)